MVRGRGHLELQYVKALRRQAFTRRALSPFFFQTLRSCAGRARQGNLCAQRICHTFEVSTVFSLFDDTVA